MVQEDDGEKHGLYLPPFFPVEVSLELNLTLQFLGLQILEVKYFTLDTGLTIQHTPALTQ